ncbi:hypothetical protein [Methylobacter sp.]|uniref:hypothetical protein n=1 Tax=Methylobacter sp. TaxID=2051955 RepID=UPI003DA5E11F
MNESLVDIEALSLRCRSEQSKNYIAEATLCYRAGAYRAAIVSTWIAVVFDLIDKIRDLAVAGDATARDLESQFKIYVDQINEGNQQGVTKGLEFEREILDVCRDKLQFFDQQQLIDLYRLKEDRHRCAHPSFQQVGVPYKPSAEQARLHIRNAVVHVLAQPPVQGKAALAGIKKLVVSEYFPEDVHKAVLQLRKAGLENPTDSLVNSTIDAFVFGFLTHEDILCEKKQVIPALNALYELHPGLFEARVGVQLSKAVRDVEDERVLWALYLVVSVNRAWDLIDQSSKDKLGRVVEVASYESLALAFESLGGVPQLRPVVEARIRNLELDQLAGVIQAKSLGNVIKERAIDLLAMSRSWDRVNAVFDKAVLPIFAILQPQDVARIIRLPTECGADLLGAHGFGLFVQKVREAALIPGAELNQLLIENGGWYLVPQPENITSPLSG